MHMIRGMKLVCVAVIGYAIGARAEHERNEAEHERNEGTPGVMGRHGVQAGVAVVAGVGVVLVVLHRRS
jgi:hypothetical protein